MSDQQDEFTAGVNAAAAMLEKMADDLADQHSLTDRDTGVREISRKYEDEYNRLRELAGDIRSIVHGNSGGK
jgi:hypothetical protein